MPDLKRTAFQVFTDIGKLVTMQGARVKEGRQIREPDLTVIPNAAIVVSQGKIQWVGPAKKLPQVWKYGVARRQNFQGQYVSLNQATVFPGLIECHTHSVFAGNRAEEFSWRLHGVSYQEIAGRGGGILSTMAATRRASATSLRQQLQARARQFVEQGVTTLEIKSGYGLSKKDELKLLTVIDVLSKQNIVRVVSTFLGAHALPPEFKTYGSYLEFLVDQVLPEVARKKLSRRVDIFVEKGFFEKAEARNYLQKARTLGFDLVIHADQLSLSGGAELAVKLGARSADHLIRCQAREIKMLAKSNVTAVFLPLADLYMRCPYPPAREFLDAGARVAIATDFNPGSAPSQDVSLTGLLGRLQMGMSLPEVLAAYTVGAAYALGLENEVGVLAPGYSADFVSTDADWQELFYAAGSKLPSRVFFKGIMRHQI